MGVVFCPLHIYRYRCRLVRRTFTCVFGGLFERRLGRGLFNIHRVPVLILLRTFYHVIPLLHLTVSRWWRHSASCHYRRRLRRLNFLRCSATDRSGVARPGNVLIQTWFALCVSPRGIPKETLQTSPHFGGIQSIRLCAELANGTFDDRIPRLVMSTNFLGI